MFTSAMTRQDEARFKGAMEDDGNPFGLDGRRQLSSFGDQLCHRDQDEMLEGQVERRKLRRVRIAESQRYKAGDGPEPSRQHVDAPYVSDPSHVRYAKDWYKLYS